MREGWRFQKGGSFEEGVGFQGEGIRLAGWLHEDFA